MAFATKGVLHELKRRQEKEKAVRLLNENEIPMELEKMLNIVAVERPQDVFGRMAEYFQELARPEVVSRLSGRMTYDSCFNKALHLDLFCVINGREKVDYATLMLHCSVVPASCLFLPSLVDRHKLFNASTGGLQGSQ